MNTTTASQVELSQTNRAAHPVLKEVTSVLTLFSVAALATLFMALQWVG